MHLVPRRKVTNSIESGDLVAAVRWKRDAPAYVKNPHRRLAPASRRSGIDLQLRRCGPAARQIYGPEPPDPGFVIDCERQDFGRHRPVEDQVFGIIGNRAAVGAGDIEVNDAMFRR